MRIHALLLVFLALFSLAAAPARAATVLLVTDQGFDVSIANALRADGHMVEPITFDFSMGNNPTLRGDLAMYDAVIWSATSDGFSPHTDVEAFENLRGYVDGGGHLLVVGGDPLAFPDSLLLDLIGATGAVGFGGDPGPIGAGESSLTSGVADLAGVTPQSWSFQYPGLSGVQADVQIVATGAFGGGIHWTVRPMGGGEVAFVSTGSRSYFRGEPWLATTPAATAAYNIAVRNFVMAADGTASMPGAPTVRFTGTGAVDEGGEINITAEITDPEGDEVTWSWDLDGDGMFGERAGETNVRLAAGDGDRTVRVAVQASDGTNEAIRTRSVRVRNVAPSIESSPPTRASIDENVRYQPRVLEPGGADDPLTYTMVRGPEGAVFRDGVFTWRPTDRDVTAVGIGIPVEIAIADDDMGRTTQSWMMMVSSNRAPTDLSLEYPRNGIGLLDRRPRLVVGNGVDGDGDTISYFFELDRVDTFDSEAIIRSDEVTAGVGFTAWQVTEDLDVGTWYWRAWLTDGETITNPQTTFFVEVPDPSMIPDAGMPDAGADAGSTTAPPAARGCSVAAAGASSAVPGALLLVAVTLLYVVVVRRRRSR